MKESGPLAAAGLEEARPDSLGAVVVAPTTTTTAPGPTRSGDPTNFEYEDSEWDVGIGNLIIDLDADIEKNNGPAGNKAAASGMPSGTSPNASAGSSPTQAVVKGAAATTNNTSASSSSTATTTTTTTTQNSSNGAAAAAKMAAAAVHSATVEPGLKMKIKRTKPGPGTRSSETKHEIVKSSQDGTTGTTTTTTTTTAGSATAAAAAARPANNNNNNNHNNNNKRGPSTNHKRDKSKEKVASPATPASKIGATPTTTFSVATAAAAVTGMTTASGGVTVTPVTGGGSPAALRAAIVPSTTSSLTVTPVVVAIPSSRTPPLTVVLPAGMTNGTNGASPTYTPPVTVTPVTPALVVNNLGGLGRPDALIVSSGNKSLSSEPPSPPAKKWRSHLASDKVSCRQNFFFQKVSSCAISLEKLEKERTQKLSPLNTLHS